jgi:hypothetical protein
MRKILQLLIKPFYRAPDFIIGGAENPYLLRWWVIPRNPIFNIYLHKFLRDDDDRALHDHPWVNCSIVLRGKYLEHTPDGIYLRKPGSVVCRRATAAHRIELKKVYIKSSGRFHVRMTTFPAWTLFITGPRIREWGFHCPKGWRPWQEFTSPADKGKIGKGCD